MSDKTTRRMLPAYEQSGPVTMFFAGMFQTPAINFHNSEKIEYDIVRSGEKIAIAVTDMSTGHRIESGDIYTNKELTPAVLKYKTPISSHDLLKRSPGQNPFEDNNFLTKIGAKVIRNSAEIQRMIMRTIELMCSQLMQTGTVTLTDENGNGIYTIDFKPKATHFPQVSVSWSNHATADPLGDLGSLANVIRTNGLTAPNEIDMGIDAFNNFIQIDGVKELFDNRRIDMGSIGPLQKRGEGASYRGTIDIDHYKYDVYTYEGRYTDPETGASTPYLDPNKVVMRDNMARLDLTYGSIPNIGRELGINGSGIVPAVEGRFSSTVNGIDLTTSVWVTESGEEMFAGFGTRPLPIPTAIDRFGCLNTVQP